MLVPRSEKFILTAAHCIAHKDNGLVKKMECLRIRVPEPEVWYEAEENLARKGENDPRFYDFFISDPKQWHIFPNYLDGGNPNTGDDLGFIQIPDETILPHLRRICNFWELAQPRDRKRIQFSVKYHKGKQIYKSFI